MTEKLVSTEDMTLEEREMGEEFALVAVNSAIEFVGERDIEPSTMLAALGSAFWTYLMFISSPRAASSNIDNAMKFMASSAEEARRRIKEIEWAEKMTHGQKGNA
jgi:hypothetical protein